ncbi:hypothetical protein ABPG72_012350 [Tetrahymena utriculariae]
MQLIKQAQNIYYSHSLIQHLIKQQQQQNNSLIEMQVTNKPTNQPTNNKKTQQITKQLTKMPLKNIKTYYLQANCKIINPYKWFIYSTQSKNFFLSKRMQFFKQGQNLKYEQKAICQSVNKKQIMQSINQQINDKYITKF